MMQQLVRYSLLLGLFCGYLPSHTDAHAVEPSLVLLDAKVWTVDPDQPCAEAVALYRGTITHVGTTQQIEKLIGPNTKVLRLCGKRVLPAFGDAHVHFLAGGRLLSQVQLKDAEDKATFLKQLSDYANKTPAGRWILGGNWDHDRAFGGELPTAKLIDQAVPNHPVFIDRYDGHMAVVNSLVLQQANITAQTPDPAGGVIVRDENGEPTGVLRDTAMQLVTPLIPQPSDLEIVEAILAALAETRRLGITFIDDMGGSGAEVRARVIRLYQKLQREGKLTTRIDAYWPVSSWKRLATVGVKAGFGDDQLRLGGLKGFIDGSLGSSTAKFGEPYVHEPGNTGVYLTPPNTLSKQMEQAHDAGLALAIHAIGDQGNATVLDMFSRIRKASASEPLHPFRIEHAQHVHRSDFERFAKLNVVASMQPYHVIDDGRWAEGRIGAERCKTSYAYRSMLDAGVRLAFGSDWAVAPLNPMLGIVAAVNRRTLDGKNPEGWFPEQSISVEEAIEAYTMGVAYARGQSAHLGSITPGKWADFVVLSNDILDPKNKDGIAQTTVTLTVMNGKVIYEDRASDEP